MWDKVSSTFPGKHDIQICLFPPCLQQPCSGSLVEVSRSASSRYRCLMEGLLSGRWVISTHFLPFSLLQSTEQTSIDIEFTECLNTSFAKSSTGEKMKAGGVSAQQTTESGNLGCDQWTKTGGDANNNNEENARKWKRNLEAACQGEQLSSSGPGGHLDGWTRNIWMDGRDCQFN